MQNIRAVIEQFHASIEPVTKKYQVLASLLLACEKQQQSFDQIMPELNGRGCDEASWMVSRLYTNTVSQPLATRQRWWMPHDESSPTGSEWTDIQRRALETLVDFIQDWKSM
ncbi:Uu.00g106110.m01.CDS01 [Anthostomella pinea]|uniref:Uu.00g106110.m01.CDS01 n=1 Tax=Anthostomella pinea TaxID=933095 RepID=A0AAI8VF32_9PEZI|nr:Uu.00g106110.m01.CDS01 [Anthostomella pinea]